MFRKLSLPLYALAALGLVGGCAQILGLGQYGNCRGGNIDIEVPCGSGGSGGETSSSSSGGPNGGGGGTSSSSISSASSGAGGGGSQGPTCTLGGSAATIISSTDVPGAVWNSFLMVAASKSDAPVFFAVYDRVSRTLYLRGVSNLQLPDELVAWPPGGMGGDIDLYGGAIVGANLVFHVRYGNDVGDLVVPLQGNHIQSAGIAFTPYPNLPSGCTTPPAFPKALSVDADGSAAYMCSDGGTPEMFTLYLDGDEVASSDEPSKVSVSVNHKFASGKRMILTFGQKGSYVRFGSNAASLGAASLLKLSATAASDIELVTPLTAKAYGPNDFVLIGADVPSTFASYALYSGRVPGTAAALGAQPPTGLTKSFSANGVGKVLVGMQGDDDGSTIVMAGASAAQTDVLLDFFDKDGKALVIDFPVVTASPTTILGAGAAHSGLGSSLMVGWADTTSVQARTGFCSTK